MVIDGTPCDGKLSCTVWSGGKSAIISKDNLSLFDLDHYSASLTSSIGVKYDSKNPTQAVG